MPWELTGNSGTNPAANFLGTKDAQSLVIKTNGQEAMRIDSDGKVGIGTYRPLGTFPPSPSADARLQVTSLEPQVHLTGTPPSSETGPRPITTHGSPAILRLTDGGTHDPFQPPFHFPGTTWDIPAGGDLHIFTPDVGNVMTLTQSGQAWFKGSLRTDSGHITTNSPNGALVLNAGPPDASNVAGIWFRKTATLGDSGYYTDLMRITADGNVGIGTTTPNARLSINGGGAVINGVTVGTDVAGINYPYEYETVGISDVRFNLRLQSPNAIILHTGNPPTERMLIDQNGNVAVHGDIILTNADCAEEFDIEESTEVEPGTVMVLAQDGMLRQSEAAYDKRVAGVISGAGDYKPGIILDKQQVLPNRRPVALVGKVYCKVDARYAAIEVGDLLTTSSMAGHAMKVDDTSKAFGAVIGKALRPLFTGCGLIPILIALQ